MDEISIQTQIDESEHQTETPMRKTNDRLKWMFGKKSTEVFELVTNKSS